MPKKAKKVLKQPVAPVIVDKPLEEETLKHSFSVVDARITAMYADIDRKNETLVATKLRLVQKEKDLLTKEEEIAKKHKEIDVRLEELSRQENVIKSSTEATEIKTTASKKLRSAKAMTKKATSMLAEAKQREELIVKRELALDKSKKEYKLKIKEEILLGVKTA